jgi:hypothetical protein
MEISKSWPGDGERGRLCQDGHAAYGASRTGKHDDLVTALGLATQPRRRDAWTV